MNNIWKHPALGFILLMGLVSLCADMAYEGARSLYGAYLPLLGASATALGFVAGLGELVGYGLRLLTGFLADRTRCYWGLTILGYGISLGAIPLLALVPENGWMWACGLLLAERLGKAVRQPAKSTLVSFAALRFGPGKSFAIMEAMDQLGAFLGPVMLFAVLSFKGAGLQGYALCFAILAVPALCAMVALFTARRRYPSPQDFEPQDRPLPSPHAQRHYLLYLAAVGLFALGFVDFPLITLHAARGGLVPADTLPLLYAGAMLADAVAALFFGWLYDKWRFCTLLLAGAMAAFFPFFVFLGQSFWSLAVGILLWGVGMGAQESILKAAVVSLTPAEKRGSAFGFFQTVFGLCWFLGSWCMGWLYDMNPAYLVAFSVLMQGASLPLYALLVREKA